MNRILKKHIGRAVDISASNGFDPINGVVEVVNKGIATIRYYSIRLNGNIHSTSKEGYIAYLPVNSNQIISIF